MTGGLEWRSARRGGGWNAARDPHDPPRTRLTTDALWDRDRREGLCDIDGAREAVPERVDESDAPRLGVDDRDTGSTDGSGSRSSLGEADAEIDADVDADDDAVTSWLEVDDGEAPGGSALGDALGAAGLAEDVRVAACDSDAACEADRDGEGVLLVEEACDTETLRVNDCVTVGVREPVPLRVLLVLGLRRWLGDRVDV